MKTLIVYGTRYGATASTAEEIANVLRTEGFDVKMADAKEEKIKDITPYELIVVGSGMQMGRWTGDVEDFVKRFQSQFAEKKLAVFASTGKTSSQQKEQPDEFEKTRKAALDDKIAKYQLNPITQGFFGGVFNLNKMNFLTRRAFSGVIKKQMETDGLKESEPGIYDMRDWDEIRSWAKELAQKARQN